MTKNKQIKFFLEALNNRLNRKNKRKTGYVKVFTRPAGTFRRTIKEKKVRVDISSPVVGETVFGAYITEVSARRLHTLLSAPSAFINFEKVSFKPDSPFYNMIEENWKGFPVLVFLGTSKYPFVVQTVEIATVGVNRNLSGYMRSLDNISYLEAISLKRKLQSAIPPLPVPVVEKKPRKIKPKRRNRIKPFKPYKYRVGLD